MGRIFPPLEHRIFPSYWQPPIVETQHITDSIRKDLVKPNFVVETQTITDTVYRHLLKAPIIETPTLTDSYSAMKARAIGPSLITATTVDTAIWRSFQRKCFYANGRFWAFFVSYSFTAGTNVPMWYHSTDGINWSKGGEIGTTSTDTDAFSIFFDGTYVHYARASGAYIYYGRGIPNADGTITWSATEQQAATVLGYPLRVPFVSVDSKGYPWIGFRVELSSAAHDAYVTKSSTNDGTWVTASGFPYQLNIGHFVYWCVSVVPLTNLKVYIIYCNYQNNPIFGRLWNGSSMGAEEVATSSNIDHPESHSVVAVGDDVHLVFHDRVNETIRYVKRTYGVGWGSEVIIQSRNPSDSGPTPVLTYDSDSGLLYCFWWGNPTPNHIHYRKGIGDTWYDVVDWQNEETDKATLYDRISCFYKTYGNKIGILYMTKIASPYKIKFKGFSNTVYSTL